MAAEQTEEVVSMKQNMSTQRLAFLGMMTALVFAGNYARIIMPVPVGGVPSFTLANILCVLSGLLLGPVGGLASGLGSALYDLTLDLNGQYETGQKPHMYNRYDIS